MGLFNRRNINASQAVEPVQHTGHEVQSTGGMLNLNKGDFLNLTKTSANLTNLRLAAGWDVSKSRGHYDLDICAYLMCGSTRKTTVYYSNKRAKGIYLDGDNLTGDGDGDDENIYINLNTLPNGVNRIIVAVVIYGAASRGQSFDCVDNAYVRLVDETNNNEICRYNLSKDGGSASAIKFAEIYNGPDGWSFKALGEPSNDSIESLARKLS